MKTYDVDTLQANPIFCGQVAAKLGAGNKVTVVDVLASKADIFELCILFQVAEMIPKDVINEYLAWCKIPGETNMVAATLGAWRAYAASLGEKTNTELKLIKPVFLLTADTKLRELIVKHENQL